MKKAYETPVVEKISFDYTEVVTASNNTWGGGCGTGGNGNSGAAPSGTKQTYSQSNEWYTCNSSLVADEPCGIALSGGKHTSNAYYDCGA